MIEGVATDTGQPKAVVEAIVRSVLARIEGPVGKGDTVNLVRDEIRRLGKNTIQNIVEIGRQLTEVKERLPWGQWGAWLEAEFPSWSETQVRRFMDSYQLFNSAMMADLSADDLPKLLENLAPTALYTLAKPSTPEPAREEVVARIVQGEIIPPKKVKEIVSRHSPGHPKQRSPEALKAVADTVANAKHKPQVAPGTPEWEAHQDSWDQIAAQARPREKAVEFQGAMDPDPVAELVDMYCRLSPRDRNEAAKKIIQAQLGETDLRPAQKKKLTEALEFLTDYTPRD